MNINYTEYKNLLIQISYKELKIGNNYFYSKDNDTPIFYLGKLIDIKKDYKFILKAFIFKYNDRDVFGETEISKDEFKGLKLFEIKQNINNGEKQSSLEKINNFSSKNKNRSFLSSSIFPLFSSKIICKSYDTSLPKITDYTDVEKWVKSYCNKNEIKIGNNITINRSRDIFSDNNFVDFKDTEIYDSGAGKNDCLIRSLLFCMSDSYRKLDENGRNPVGSYFRRAFLPWFFKENIDVFKTYIKDCFTEDNGTLFIKDFTPGIRTNTKVKLNDLLCGGNFLPDKIGELLCRKLGINLLIFVPGMNGNIKNYFPNFYNNNSNFTISICGDNTHFRSCKIKYKEDLNLKFILDQNYTDVENSVTTIQLIKNPNINTIKTFNKDSCFTFNNKIYKIHTKLFDSAEKNKNPEPLYLFSYIPTEKIIDENILNIDSIKNGILPLTEETIFKLNGINVDIVSNFKTTNSNKENLYFYDGKGNIYKIYRINFKENKQFIFEVNCNNKGNVRSEGSSILKLASGEINQSKRNSSSPILGINEPKSSKNSNQPKKTDKEEINPSKPISSSSIVQSEKTDEEKLNEEIKNILKKIETSTKYTPQQNKDLSNRIKNILSKKPNNLIKPYKNSLEIGLHALNQKLILRYKKQQENLEKLVS